MSERKRMVSEKVVAEITGWDLSKIRNDRWRKIGLSYYKLGRCVRYDTDEVYEFLRKNRVEVGTRGGTQR